MRFFMMATPDENTGTGPPPDPKVMAEMGALVEEGFKNGTLLATGGLHPHKIRITSSGSEITVTEGPFAEAKEAVVGWALVSVGSKEEAIELSKRFWRIVGDATGTIQRVFEPGELPGT